jgi:SHS2 domain-containing protein
MAETAERWHPEERDKVYTELDHPADIFLEVWGADLPTLFENALFALYDQLAELAGFEACHEETIMVSGATAAEALRALLSEALYRFESARFVAARAKVVVEEVGSTLEVSAELHGEKAHPTRHTLLSEVKGVTYHQLTAERAPEGGWRATVLFDV